MEEVVEACAARVFLPGGMEAGGPAMAPVLDMTPPTMAEAEARGAATVQIQMEAQDFKDWSLSSIDIRTHKFQYHL